MNSIELLMKECNNYFYKWKEIGTFAISNNTITGIKGNYLVGQYILIRGSILNDGVYKIETFNNNIIGITGLYDETFEGSIYGLAVPKSFIELADKIDEHLTNLIPKNANKVSESFNNYSVSYATGKSGKPLEWQTIYSDTINNFRNVYDDERRVNVI